MGQELSSSVIYHFQRPSVSLSKALAQSSNAPISNARFHPHSSKRRLFDDYEVQSKAVLGRGTGGDAVVMAYSRKGRRQKFAVKTLDQRRGTRNLLWQRAAEIEICLTLDHPHVVRLHDVYESEYGLFYLVMECCTGGELFFRLAESKRFTEHEACKAAAEMVRAVGYLHAHGIVHRDLKPENFLYESDADGAPLKLIDFGFGEMWDPGRLMQTCCGSLNYVSPEVLQQQGYTDKCDMWSLGVITFILLTGCPPFNGNERQLKGQITGGKVNWATNAPNNPWSSLSKEALEYVKSLLEPVPDQRLGANKAIFHPWFIKESLVGMGSPHLDSRLMQSLRRYAATPPLERAVLQLMAQLLAPNEVSDLCRTFLELDMENKGVVRIADLKDSICRSSRKLQSTPEASGQEAPTDAVELCALLEGTFGRRLSYTDFLAAGLSLEEQLGTEKMVAGAFSRLDADSSGFIGLEDVKEVFGDAFDKETVLEWLRSASPEAGQVSLADFTSSLRRLAGPSRSG